jgi:hypothetical protein
MATQRSFEGVSADEIRPLIDFLVRHTKAVAYPD